MCGSLYGVIFFLDCLQLAIELRRADRNASALFKSQELVATEVERQRVHAITTNETWQATSVITINKYFNHTKCTVDNQSYNASHTTYANLISKTT